MPGIRNAPLHRTRPIERVRLAHTPETKQARAACASSNSAPLSRLCAAPVHDAAHEEEPGRLAGQEARREPGQDVQAQAVRCLPVRTQHVCPTRTLQSCRSTLGSGVWQNACITASTMYEQNWTDAAHTHQVGRDRHGVMTQARDHPMKGMVSNQHPCSIAALVALSQASSRRPSPLLETRHCSALHFCGVSSSETLKL